MVDYPFTSQVHRDEDSLGLDVAGRMMLVPAQNFRAMIDEMSAAFAVPP